MQPPLHTLCLRNLILLLGMACLLSGCLGQPKNVQVITQLDANRYLGTWYEIARLDHSFERGLEQVTATYSKRDDGGIQVINRGFDTEDKAWQQAIGKAYFIDPTNSDGSYTGKLKVSFFGPFYGAYNIIALDEPGYQHVMICGPNLDYLWILARTPTLDKTVQQELVAQAKALGFSHRQADLCQAGGVMLQPNVKAGLQTQVAIAAIRIL